MQQQLYLCLCWLIVIIAQYEYLCTSIIRALFNRACQVDVGIHVRIILRSYEVLYVRYGIIGIISGSRTRLSPCPD